MEENAEDASKYYVLADNIRGAATVFREFKGHFDGSGYVIKDAGKLFDVVGEGAEVSGITMEDPVSINGGNNNVGGYIAGKNYGTIKDCYVATIGYVSGTKDMGGITGENIGGTIKNCYYKGTVQTTGSGAGGIVGYNSYGTIEGCRADVTVAATGHGAGGVAGDNSNGTIINCCATGSVGKGAEVGGIAGRLYNGSILNSYSLCLTQGSDSVGGIVGAVIENGYTENVLYAADKAKCDYSIGSLQTADYASDSEATKYRSAYGGFDFDTVWTIDEGASQPALRAISGAGTRSEPYLIRSRFDFNDENSEKRAYYRQINDITLSGSWKASGSFKGSYDGGGYLLTGGNKLLESKIGEGAYIGNVHMSAAPIAASAEGAVIEYCTVTASSSMPFLQYAENCTIRNCAVYYGTNRFTANTNTGGFVSELVGGSVTDCLVKNVKLYGKSLLGGFVGINSGGAIKGCYVENAEISGKSSVGGFVGRNDKDGAIEDSFCQASVSGDNYAGVFAGMNYARISGCKGFGQITPSEDESGNVSREFAGVGDGTISNCGVDITDNFPVKPMSFGGTAAKPNIPELAAETPAETDASGTELSDISGHWAERTIRALVSKGVVNGYEDGTYRPQNGVTKGEFIKLLLAASGTKIKTGNFTGYEDVNKSWAKDYVYTALSMGICDNIDKSASEFGVNDEITRAEATALLGRLTNPSAQGEPEFTDTAEIPSWAVSAVYASVKLGLITGMEDGSFKPENNLTRAEAAVIIERVLNLKK